MGDIAENGGSLPMLLAVNVGAGEGIFAGKDGSSSAGPVVLLELGLAGDRQVSMLIRPQFVPGICARLLAAAAPFLDGSAAATAILEAASEIVEGIVVEDEEST